MPTTGTFNILSTSSVPCNIGDMPDYNYYDDIITNSAAITDGRYELTDMGLRYGITVPEIYANTFLTSRVAEREAYKHLTLSRPLLLPGQNEFYLIDELYMTIIRSGNAYIGAHLQKISTNVSPWQTTAIGYVTNVSDISDFDTLAFGINILPDENYTYQGYRLRYIEPHVYTRSETFTDINTNYTRLAAYVANLPDMQYGAVKNMGGTLCAGYFDTNGNYKGFPGGQKIFLTNITPFSYVGDIQYMQFFYYLPFESDDEYNISMAANSTLPAILRT